MFIWLCHVLHMMPSVVYHMGQVYLKGNAIDNIFSIFFLLFHHRDQFFVQYIMHFSCHHTCDLNFFWAIWFSIDGCLFDISHSMWCKYLSHHSIILYLCGNSGVMFILAFKDIDVCNIVIDLCDIYIWSLVFKGTINNLRNRIGLLNWWLSNRYFMFCIKSVSLQIST